MSRTHFRENPHELSGLRTKWLWVRVQLQSLGLTWFYDIIIRNSVFLTPFSGLGISDLETFTALGCKSYGKLFGAIWHEGITGRSAEEVSSTYSKIFCHPKLRDYKNIVVLADTCSSQNKSRMDQMPSQ